ncbi:MAG: hypothetical protein ABI995_06425, partial [Acidobacteriota bacterium]
QNKDGRKAAAAYGLCGVYQKTKNPIEQLHFALWLAGAEPSDSIHTNAAQIGDQSIYWAVSGFDLGLLLDSEASIPQLEEFVQRYPNVKDVRRVKYALAVRLSRENRYQEAADLYRSIAAVRRTPRLRRLATLYGETQRTDAIAQQLATAKYQAAEFLSQNSDRIYFNDDLWHGFQTAALYGAEDSRLTRSEHEAASARERQLKDQQEELWRAAQLLQEVVKDAGPTDLGRKAARLAIQCLRRINVGRFGREDEIRTADIQLSKWLLQR